MARTTPWTIEQQEKLDKLHEEGRIKNERPCGCFDVYLKEGDEMWTAFTLIPCDSCWTVLTKMFNKEN